MTVSPKRPQDGSRRPSIRGRVTPGNPFESDAPPILFQLPNLNRPAPVPVPVPTPEPEPPVEMEAETAAPDLIRIDAASETPKPKRMEESKPSLMEQLGTHAVVFGLLALVMTWAFAIGQNARPKTPKQVVESPDPGHGLIEVTDSEIQTQPSQQQADLNTERLVDAVDPIANPTAELRPPNIKSSLQAHAVSQPFITQPATPQRPVQQPVVSQPPNSTQRTVAELANHPMTTSLRELSPPHSATQEQSAPQLEEPVAELSVDDIAIDFEPFDVETLEASVPSLETATTPAPDSVADANAVANELAKRMSADKADSVIETAELLADAQSSAKETIESVEQIADSASLTAAELLPSRDKELALQNDLDALAAQVDQLSEPETSLAERQPIARPTTRTPLSPHMAISQLTRPNTTPSETTSVPSTAPSMAMSAGPELSLAEASSEPTVNPHTVDASGASPAEPKATKNYYSRTPLGVRDWTSYLPPGSRR